MKVLLTGSRGFVGRHMFAFFAQEGLETIGLDLSPSSKGLSCTSQVVCDIREVRNFRNLFQGIDVVIHLASAHLDVRLNDETYWSTNVQCLQPLLETANGCGVKHFIHTSSVGVHGSLEKVPGDEDSPLAPDNIYDKTKAAGEAEIQRFLHRCPEMGITIVRPSWIYGVGDARTEKILRTVNKGMFVFFGPGTNYRHPIYISDYLTGIRQMLLNPQTFGKTYILAGPEYMTTRPLLRTVEHVTGGKIRLGLPISVASIAGVAFEKLCSPLRVVPPISRRTGAFFKSSTAFDTSRARNDFGFAPRVNVREGMSLVWAQMNH